MQQGIIIGRDPSCDICVDERYGNVSRRHARICRDGENLVLEDMSTNGSYVNGHKINHSRALLKRGDTVYLGKDYLLAWQDMERFFPSARSTHRDFPDNPERQTELFRPPVVSPCPLVASPGPAAPQEDTETLLKQWNWGAFGLYPFWGFANGMWWWFLVAVFLGWLFPVVNIVLGVKGSRWAWEMKEWRSIEHFRQVQESWKPWGIAIMVLNAFIYIMIFGAAAV